MKVKLCEYCDEPFDSRERVEVDCGLSIWVYDHLTWTCPAAKDRIPYDHEAMLRKYEKES